VTGNEIDSVFCPIFLMTTRLIEIIRKLFRVIFMNALKGRGKASIPSSTQQKGWK